MENDAKPNYRMARIERLLHELEYEVTRGMMEGEIDESLVFEFFVPLSKRIPDGVVGCRFQTRPMHRYAMPLGIENGPGAFNSTRGQPPVMLRIEMPTSE